MKRLFKNWKTTLIGLVILAVSSLLFYQGKIAIKEYLALLPTVLFLFRVKDTFLGGNTTITPVVLLIGLLSFSSCSYQKKLNKWCQRCPSTESHDTIKIKHDSIVMRDSVMRITLPPLPSDTIMISAPCPQIEPGVNHNVNSGVINIPRRTFNYDYVNVEVWVDHNMINVKPYLDTNKINVLIKNAKLEVYRQDTERYKNTKNLTVIVNHIPKFIWWLLGILLAGNIIQFIIIKYFKK